MPQKLQQFMVLVFVVVAGGTSCSSIKINDFATWCNYVHDPRQGQYDIFSMDREAVIDDLVKTWDRILIENNASVLGISPAEVEADSVIRELRRIKMIGAWRTGDTVSFSIGLIPSPVVTADAGSAEVFAAEYNERLSAVRRDGAADQMDPVTYCLYDGLDIFFARLDVYTSDGTASVTTQTFERLKKF